MQKQNSNALARLCAEAIKKNNSEINGHMWSHGNCVWGAANNADGTKFIVAAAKMRKFFPPGLTGDTYADKNGFVMSIDGNYHNANIIADVLPYCRPAVFSSGTATVNSGGECQPGEFTIFDCDQNEDAWLPDMVWQRCRDGENAGQFAIRQSVCDAKTQLSERCSIFLFRPGADSVDDGGNDADYCGMKFILPTLSAVEYHTIPGRCNRLLEVIRLTARRLKKKRTIPFVIAVDATGGGNPALTVTELLFIARELRKNSVANVVFIMPEKCGDDHLATLYYGDCTVWRQGCDGKIRI